jgi:hypothetical protein
MSPRQIAVVRGSSERVLPIKERAAELFYRRLFELDLVSNRCSAGT